jgi:ABC-type molybdate transport system permease subunit
MFPVGVALVGAYWFATIVKNWKGAFKNPLVKKLTLLLVAITIVSFINPLGISGVIYSLKANTVGATKVFSSEVQSIAEVFKVEPKSDYLGAVLFMPLLILLALFCHTKRNQFSIF